MIIPTEKPHYTIVVDDSLLRQIGDFHFENRFPSHSAATLDLIRRDIRQLKREQETSRKDSDRE